MGPLSCPAYTRDDSVERRHRQVVELSDGVRLGPKANTAGGLKGVVFHVEELAIVEKHLDEFSLHEDAELVPLPVRHVGFHPVRIPFATHPDVGSCPVLRPVGDDITLQGVGSDDVEVPLVPVAKDQPSGRIDLAADRFEPHGHVDIRRRKVFSDELRIALVRPVVAKLCEHSCSRRRVADLIDLPIHRTAATGESGDETGGRLSRWMDLRAVPSGSYRPVFRQSAPSCFATGPPRYRDKFVRAARH